MSCARQGGEELPLFIMSEVNRFNLLCAKVASCDTFFTNITPLDSNNAKQKTKNTNQTFCTFLAPLTVQSYYPQPFVCKIAH